MENLDWFDNQNLFTFAFKILWLMLSGLPMGFYPFSSFVSFDLDSFPFLQKFSKVFTDMKPLVTSTHFLQCRFAASEPP
jgi:hypothetical protein